MTGRPFQIALIKWIRNHTSLGLKDAKDISDLIHRRMEGNLRILPWDVSHILLKKDLSEVIIQFRNEANIPVQTKIELI